MWDWVPLTVLELRRGPEDYMRREVYRGLGVDRTERWTELLQASRFLCMLGEAFLADESWSFYA